MPARSLIISLSFLLWFSFTTTKPLSLASASEEAVNDVDGDALVPGREYYIVSAIWGAGGGGVKPVKTGNASSCSYSVVQEGSDLQMGAPVKFHVKGTSTEKIYAGYTDLEIEFAKKPGCAESSKWVVAYESGSSSSSLVIGGPEDHPDSVLVSGVFHIEVLNSISYKLVFCPKSHGVGSSSSGTCYDVGIGYKDGFHRSLVVREQNSEYGAFMVVFVKADSVKGRFSII